MKNHFHLGFTLIEFVILILVLSILIVVIFTWPGKTANLRQQANQLASDIRYIQHYAMTHGARYRINFSAASYSFTDASAAVAVPHPGGAGSNIVTLDTDITLSHGLASGYLLFNSRGEPYISATTVLPSLTTLTLSASGETSRTVSVSPETGKVTVTP